jgi:hypothetical protein
LLEEGLLMAQMRILLPVLVLTLAGCAAAPERGTPSALELAARAGETPRASQCRGAKRTAVCTRDGSCGCTESGDLVEFLGLDDPAFADR